MVFVNIRKGSSRSNLSGKLEIRMGSHLQAGKGTHRGVYFSVSKEIIEAANWQMNTDGERETTSILINEGVGEDAGFLLLAQGPGGYSLGITSKNAKSFSMSVSAVSFAHYVLNDLDTSTAPVEFTIDEKEKTILIQCPDWLRYNPLSYTEPVKEVAPKPAPIAPATADKLPLNRQSRRNIAATVARALKS